MKGGRCVRSDAIYGEGRGAVADVFIEGTESNRVFAMDRVDRFNSSRNTAEGYERVVRREMTDTLKSFLRENLVPDDLPGGLRKLRSNPRFKLEGDETKKLDEQFTKSFINCFRIP